jgi:dipeptidyl-peptidase-3
VTENESICHVTNTPIPNGKTIRLVNGDHRDQLARINAYLDKALEYVSTRPQYEMIRKIQDSFTTGNLATYKDSQRIWVNDKIPPVETVIGFIEPYRDPLGIRSEFEGIVGITDPEETRTLNRLLRMADELVCRLPWVNRECGIKGPFEKEMFEVPDFSSVQSMCTPFSFRCCFAYSC